MVLRKKNNYLKLFQDTTLRRITIKQQKNKGRIHIIQPAVLCEDVGCAQIVLPALVVVWSRFSNC
jgi:hypothetical protein